jgi:hypothetical protein
VSAPDADRRRHPGPALEGDAVRFTDKAAIGWRVTEHDGLLVPGSRGPRYLRFDSQYAVRRVWSYPASWRTLSMPALEAVGWGR